MLVWFSDCPGINTLVKRGNSDTVLIKADVLPSTELVTAILYKWIGQLCLKNENSFRHIGSLMEVDWFHPGFATFEVYKYFLSSQLVGVSGMFVKSKLICI